MVVDLNDFEIASIPNPVWAKIPAISRAFNTYPEAEWVWWLDADAIIMTSHIDLYEHLLNPTALQRHLRDGDLIKTNQNVPPRSQEPIRMKRVMSLDLNVLIWRMSIPLKSTLSAWKTRAGSMLGHSSFATPWPCDSSLTFGVIQFS